MAAVNAGDPARGLVPGRGAVRAACSVSCMARDPHSTPVAEWAGAKGRGRACPQCSKFICLYPG